MQPETPNPLAVMQPGEQVIFELKRHPIGIIIIYAITGLALTGLAVLAFGVVPANFSDSAQDQVAGISAAVFMVFTLLCLIFNLVVTIIYWGNRWILTDDSITQISQVALFRKESSQLGLESLEDVTVEQHGIFSHLFNYGEIHAQTAAHQDKFIFSYAPKPTYYAQKILAAHEAVNERVQAPR